MSKTIILDSKCNQSWENYREQKDEEAHVLRCNAENCSVVRAVHRDNTNLKLQLQREIAGEDIDHVNAVLPNAARRAESGLKGGGGIGVCGNWLDLIYQK
ncbi:hypothetical protein COP1_041754 [Malus domestica]